MRKFGSKAIGTIPPVARRDRRILRAETELEQLRDRTVAAETDRARLQQNLGRALRRVEEQREQRRDVEGAKHQLSRELEEAQEKIRKLEGEQVQGPSFRGQLIAYREFYDQREQADSYAGVPMWQMPFKLRNYSLGRSHGVDVPLIYQVWNSPEEIDLGAVEADRVVLKSDGGHSGHGVFVLQRTPSGWQSLDGGLRFEGQQPAPEILDRFSRWHGPYFAEEFLESTTGTAVPEDIKVYTAYGEVMQILLMQASVEGDMDRESFTRRYLGPRGEDLGRVAAMGTHNSAIPVPEDFDGIVDISRHLSRASGMPFVRVDLYQTPRGLVLGELTPTPGGRQKYQAEHDQHMGRSWIQAQVRLEQDLAAGRPHGSLFGRKKYTWWYPPADDARGGNHPSQWPRTHRACTQWCRPDA